MIDLPRGEAMAAKAKASKAKATKAKATKARSSKAKAATGARKARSVSSAQLTKLTAAAVKAATGRTIPIIKEPIWGFVLQEQAGALDIAARVAQGVSAGAREAGFGATARGARTLQPSVVLRPGVIIAGYFPIDLPFQLGF
jgi:hypothetical protein